MTTTGDQYIGRREGIGFGVGAAGSNATAASPSMFYRWLKADLQEKTEVLENESSMGVVEKVNDSEVTSQWLEGKVGGKVTDQAIGYFLLGMFGQVTTTGTGTYTHSFSVSQSSIPPAITLARVSPFMKQRHPYTTFDSLEVSCEEKGWVQVESAVKARIGTTSSDVTGLISEKEFTSKTIVTKIAANTAGLAGATALPLKGVKLNLERKSESFDPLGGNGDPEFDRGEWETKGEFVVRYKTTEYSEDFLANTIKAMSIAITNGPSSLTFTLPQVRYRELERSTDRENIVTQTISFAGEFSTTAASQVTAVLVNAKSGYTS